VVVIEDLDDLGLINSGDALPLLGVVDDHNARLVDGVEEALRLAPTA